MSGSSRTAPWVRMSAQNEAKLGYMWPITASEIATMGAAMSAAM